MCRRPRARSRGGRSSTPSGASAPCARRRRRSRSSSTRCERCAMSAGAAPGRRSLMYLIVAGGGKVGANVASSLLAMGHEVTLVEQRRDRFEVLEEEFGPVVVHGDATEMHVLERAGIDRPPDIVLRRDRRRRGQPRHRAAREGGLRRPQGDRARQRPAQPAALRSARDHADRLRHVRTSSASSSTRCPSTASCACSSCGRRGSRSSRCRSRAIRPRPGKRVAGLSLPEDVRLVSVTRNGVGEIAVGADGDSPRRPGDRDPQARARGQPAARARRVADLDQTRQ